MQMFQQCFDLGFSSYFHRVFLSRPSDVAKTVFSSFLHRSLCENHCMLLHVFRKFHRFFFASLIAKAFTSC